MLRVLANPLTSTNGVCRLLVVHVSNHLPLDKTSFYSRLLTQARNATATATNAQDTKKPDMVHLKRESQPRKKTVSIYRWVTRLRLSQPNELAVFVR